MRNNPPPPHAAIERGNRRRSDFIHKRLAKFDPAHFMRAAQPLPRSPTRICACMCSRQWGCCRRARRSPSPGCCPPRARSSHAARADRRQEDLGVQVLGGGVPGEQHHVHKRPQDTRRAHARRHHRARACPRAVSVPEPRQAVRPTGRQGDRRAPVRAVPQARPVQEGAGGAGSRGAQRPLDFDPGSLPAD